MRGWVMGCCVWVAACRPGAPPPAPVAKSSGGEQAAPAQDSGPPRLRFAHFPREYPNFRIAASRIDFQLVDPRTAVPAAPALAQLADGATITVGLPAGFAAVVEERLTRVTSGRGRELKLVIEIRKLEASRSAQLRRVDAAFNFIVRDSRDAPLLRGHGEAGKDLEGAPLDDAELDELHRAACADALDNFLASETNIALINEVMASH